MTDFLVEGGKIERVEFHSPSELNQVAQKVVINATGYGARALWKDESIVPVRGQIAWLIPQPEVNYGVIYKNVDILARRDGIVVQDVGKGEMDGYNDANEAAGPGGGGIRCSGRGGVVWADDREPGPCGLISRLPGVGAPCKRGSAHDRGNLLILIDAGAPLSEIRVVLCPAISRWDRISY